MEDQVWVALRREDKSVWECRTALTPADIKELLDKHADLRFKVQPSKKRIFSDAEYEEAGAVLDQDITDCSLILGIKEIPAYNFIPNKTFLCFNHVDKGVPYLMPALDTCLENNIRLIDYEFITDANSNRLIAFGKYAGIAGAIDFLKGLGEYLMCMGIRSPLLSVNSTYKYFDIEEAYSHLSKIGQKIKDKKIPKELAPMIFGVTGKGRVSQGVFEVLDTLGVARITPAEMEDIWADRTNPKHLKTIYYVVINTEDCMVPMQEGALYERSDFHANPSTYTCNFSTRFLPYITALFMGIYWNPRYPKYIMNSDLLKLHSEGNLRLLGISDITADIGGPIECLQEYTTPERPFFYYDIEDDQHTFDPSYKHGKIVYQAVDFLPCELAYDASVHFSSILKKWIYALARSPKDLPLQEQGLPLELQRAVIAYQNKLTPAFEFIPAVRQQVLQTLLAKSKKPLQKEGQEFIVTNDAMLNNVKKVDNIQGQTLDFS